MPRYVTPLHRGLFIIDRFAVSAGSGEIFIRDGLFMYTPVTNEWIPKEVQRLSQTIQAAGGATRCVDFAVNGGNGDCLEIEV